MTSQQLAEVLRWKKPGAQWGIRAGVLSWLDAIPAPTQAEIDTWFAEYVSQGIEAQFEVDRQIDGQKVVKAIVLWANQRSNAAATQWNAFRAVVAAAASLADLKSGVNANTTDLSTTTPAQAKAEILAIYKAL